jgi:hypothetical protein
MVVAAFVTIVDAGVESVVAENVFSADVVNEASLASIMFWVSDSVFPADVTIPLVLVLSCDVAFVGHIAATLLSGATPSWIFCLLSCDESASRAPVSKFPTSVFMGLRASRSHCTAPDANGAH